LVGRRTPGQTPQNADDLYFVLQNAHGTMPKRIDYKVFLHGIALAGGMAMVMKNDMQQSQRHIQQTAFFPRFARNCVRVTGHPVAFGVAVATIVVWAVTGPVFRFSDSWQLVINTGTTIVTFLMVFLIQNAQNRDSEAIQLKLAELIRATQNAHNAFLDIEELSQEELDRIKDNFRRLACKARADLRSGQSDFGYSEYAPGRGRGEFTRHDLINGKTAHVVNGAAKHQGKDNI
jgi:low affinity Fe/Cu permease